MGNSLLLVCLASVWLLFNILSLPFMALGISSCGGSCQTVDDCAGHLICIDGKCDDDPDVGTHTCGGGSSPTPDPPSSRGTPALLTNNNFEEGGDGGGPSECDGKYHDNSDHIVALSTRWYDHGSRCGKMIKVTVPNGKSVSAKVVDECDESGGCRNNIVDGSDGVWNALGLDIDIGEVHVTWSMD